MDSNSAASGGHRRISYMDALEIAKACDIATRDKTENRNARQEEEEEEEEEEEVDAMLQKFHDVGLIMWHDRPETRQLVVLDVQWMLAQMTVLIDRRALKTKAREDNDTPALWSQLLEGRLSARLLPKLWPELKPQERTEVLSYMSAFGQCCRLPDKVSWLIPSLLPAAGITDDLTYAVEQGKWTELAVRFMSEDDNWPEGSWCDAKRTGFLPDTLYFRVCAFLASTVNDVQDLTHTHHDWISIQTQAQYYMVRYDRVHQLLRVHVQMTSESAAAMAREAVEAAIDHVLMTDEHDLDAREFRLQKRWEAVCHVDGVMKPIADLADDHAARRICMQSEQSSFSAQQFWASRRPASIADAQTVTTSTSSVWTNQAVFEDSELRWSIDSLRRANITDQVSFKSLGPDSTELAVAKKTLHPELLPCVRSKFVETRPHALEFIDEPALLSVTLTKSYDNADDLVVMHKAKPGTVWEVLSEEIELSEGGKRASIRVRSFCTRVIIDAAALPQQAPPATELVRALPQRPSLAHLEPDPDSEPVSCTLSGLNQAETTSSDAYFSAFAPPEIMPDGHSVLIEVVMFALAYGAEVAVDATARGKTKVSPTRKLPIMLGAEVSIVLDLPEDAFETDHNEAEVLQWDGTYATAAFEVTCLRRAELRTHVCKAIISVAGVRAAILRFELNVVRRVLPSPPVSPPSEVQTQKLTVLSRDWRVLQMQSNSSSGSQDILRSLVREREIILHLWGRDEGPGSQNLFTGLMTSYELFHDDMKLNQKKDTHICHLSGHGETRSLVFQADAERNDDNLEEPDPVAFASEVLDNGVKCLVLNCCDSGDLGRAVNRCALEQGKKVLVVCWDSPVVSKACEKVTKTFYSSILDATVDDIFVAAEQAFQEVERKYHAGCLRTSLRDCVEKPQNRFAIARCDHEGLWRCSVGSGGLWDQWEPIERKAQADDGMDNFGPPTEEERLAAARAEAERLAAEQAEAERLAAERAEQARAAQEAERERLAAAAAKKAEQCLVVACGVALLLVGVAGLLRNRASRSVT
jgi:hypothetical protein